MSRNPYLAASRPTSSFTRSSRTSKRNELSSTGRSGLGGGIGGGLLGRSRSSATLGGNLSGSQFNSYSSSNYVPNSSWQRPSSSTRLSSSSSISARPNANDNSSSNDHVGSSFRNERPSLYKSISSHDIISRTKTDSEDQNGSFEHNDNATSHLKNYQQSKLQQQATSPAASRIRSSLQSLDSDTNTDYTKRSTTSLDSSTTDITSYDEPIGDSIPSGSARRLAKSQGQLLKSQSLDISRQQQQQQQQQPENDNNTTQFLSSTMSVDRLLLRAESMGERDLRKSFKELVMENERLKRQLIGFDEKDKIRQQDWIRKERQLQRKISELEEENKQLEQWKLELQRLKDENSSLIRVVSKLSKKQ